MSTDGGFGRASVIIAAAGCGSRLGLATAKAFVELCGQPILYYSLASAASVKGVIELVIAVPPGMESAARAVASEAGVELPVKITGGGATRQDSVRIALELTSAEADLVLIHDAARPLARPELFSAVLAAASQFGAAIAAVPLADTLKRAHAGVVCATLARDGLFQSQTPQAFRRALLLSAFANAQERGWEATDEAALLERIGRQVHIAQGSAENFKITTAEDLAMAQRLVAARRRTIG